MCALLNIVDTSRVKVVGVHSGSVAVTAVFSPSSNTTSTTTNANGATTTQPEPTVGQIQSALNNAINSGAYSNTMSAALNSTVINTISTYYALTTDEVHDEDEESTNIGLIVGLVFASLAISVAGVISFIYCIRRRSKITEMPVSE